MVYILEVKSMELAAMKKQLVKDYSKKNNHDQFVRAWKELGRYSGSVKHYVELLEKYGITHINRC